MSIKVLLSPSKQLDPIPIFYEWDREMYIELWSDGAVYLEFNVNGHSFIMDGECKVTLGGGR